MTNQKSGVGKVFFFFFFYILERPSAHQDCNYLIQNTVKTVML